MVVGGLLVRLGKNSAKIQQISLALAAGSMVALLIFDLGPEIIEEAPSLGALPLIIALLAGFFILVLLDKVFHNAKYGHVHTHHIAEHTSDSVAAFSGGSAANEANIADKTSAASADSAANEALLSIKEEISSKSPATIKGACTESYIHIGLISALALILHNIIEGMAVYSVALSSPESGLLYALAIVLHNIPIGMLLFVTLTRSSGYLQRIVIVLVTCSTFIGALFALCLSGILDERILSIFVALATGMLCYIVAIELIPRLVRTKPVCLSVISAIVGFLIVFGASFLM